MVERRGGLPDLSRSFHDSNGDGIGDFRGLLEKLEYIRDLGVNTIWLMPFYPSPLRDDGYDIADYTSVNPSYCTIDDFKMFLNEAHNRGIRVITEVVVNHTSDQHPWFQEARSSRDNPKRDWYIWRDPAPDGAGRWVPAAAATGMTGLPISRGTARRSGRAAAWSGRT